MVPVCSVSVHGMERHQRSIIRLLPGQLRHEDHEKSSPFHTVRGTLLRPLFPFTLVPLWGLLCHRKYASWSSLGFIAMLLGYPPYLCPSSTVLPLHGNVAEARRSTPPRAVFASCKSLWLHKRVLLWAFLRPLSPLPRVPRNNGCDRYHSFLDHDLHREELPYWVRSSKWRSAREKHGKSSEREKWCGTGSWYCDSHASDCKATKFHLLCDYELLSNLLFHLSRQFHGHHLWSPHSKGDLTVHSQKHLLWIYHGGTTSK